jgi:hypothetical protein
MSEFDESQTQTTEGYDVDALYNKAMGIEESKESSDAPAEDVKQGESKPTEAGSDSSEAKTEEPWAPSEDGTWSIKWGGEEKSFEADKIRQFAQMGYDYQTKMQNLNLEKKQFEREKASKEDVWNGEKEKYEHYQKIDQWAKENPDLWAAAQQAYARSTDPASQGWVDQNGQPLQDGYQDPVQRQLLQTVNDLKARLEEQDKLRETEAQVKSEASAETEISQFKHEHSTFDWDKEGEDGLNLESKIMQFGLDKGLTSFTDAANLYLMKDIIARESMRAKDSAAKNIQKRSKLGVGPLTSKPTLVPEKLSGPKATKGRYQDADSILRELGIG